jgi:hypothetical protein
LTTKKLGTTLFFKGTEFVTVKQTQKMRRRKAASDDEESDKELPVRRTRDSGTESDSSDSEHSEDEEITKSNSPRGATETTQEKLNSAKQEPLSRGTTTQEDGAPNRGYRFQSNQCKIELTFLKTKPKLP